MRYQMAPLLLLAAVLPAHACLRSLPGLDLQKLLVDVFDPQRGEKVLVMVDLPHGAIADNEAWAARREMADAVAAQPSKQLARKRNSSADVTVRVYPLLTYAATGAHNSPLPEEGMLDGKAVRPGDHPGRHGHRRRHDRVLGHGLVERVPHSGFPRLPAASMPTVARSMEQTALAADYAQVALRAHLLADRLDRAEGAEVGVLYRASPVRGPARPPRPCRRRRTARRQARRRGRRAGLQSDVLVRGDQRGRRTSVCQRRGLPSPRVRRESCLTGPAGRRA